MRRKIKCSSCGTTKNAATGQKLYILGSDYLMMLQNSMGECLDCGDARRQAEEKRKQDRREKLLGRFSD